MKIAIIGAFIFCMTIITTMYCVSEGIKEGMFALPFFMSILLIPYGLIKDGIE